MLICWFGQEWRGEPCVLPNQETQLNRLYFFYCLLWLAHKREQNQSPVGTGVQAKFVSDVLPMFIIGKHRNGKGRCYVASGTALSHMRENLNLSGREKLKNSLLVFILNFVGHWNVWVP